MLLTASYYTNITLGVLIPTIVISTIVVLTQMLTIFLEKRYPLILESSQELSDLEMDLYYLINGAISHEISRAMIKVIFKGVLGIMISLVYLLVGSKFMLSFENCMSQFHVLIQFLILYLVSDLYYYILHRKMHEKENLWPFHEIHHDSEKLYSINVTKKHPFDVLIRFAPPIPIFLVLGIDATVFMVYSVHALIFGMLQHANINMSFSGWNKIFATADTHHMHHAKDVRLGNCNYGNGLIIWDRLFDTYRDPEDSKNKVTKFGLEKPLPKSFWSQMWYPLKVILKLKRH